MKIKAAGCYGDTGIYSLEDTKSAKDIPWTSGSGYGEGYTVNVKLDEPLRFHFLEDLSEYAELEDY